MVRPKWCWRNQMECPGDFDFSLFIWFVWSSKTSILLAIFFKAPRVNAGPSKRPPSTSLNETHDDIISDHVNAIAVITSNERSQTGHICFSNFDFELLRPHKQAALINNILLMQKVPIEI